MPRKLLAQDDIEKLLTQAGKTAAAEDKNEPASSKRETPAPPALRSEGILPGDVEYLFNQAEKALESVGADLDDLPYVDLSIWEEWIANKTNMITVMMGRGCP